jgi:hypothetical protein
MKKIIISVMFLFNTCCYAEPLINYLKTVDALNNGKHITFVINWEFCKTNIPDIKPNFSSSYTPENVNIDKSGFIQSSGVKYAHEIKIAPMLGPVNHAYVYTFNKFEELHVINRFLDPITYAEKMPAFEATCQLGNGFKVFSD